MATRKKPRRVHQGSTPAPPIDMPTRLAARRLAAALYRPEAPSVVSSGGSADGPSPAPSPIPPIAPLPAPSHGRPDPPTLTQADFHPIRRSHG